jgi:hypothetical protein
MLPLSGARTAGCLPIGELDNIYTNFNDNNLPNSVNIHAGLHNDNNKSKMTTTALCGYASNLESELLPKSESESESLCLSSPSPVGAEVGFEVGAWIWLSHPNDRDPVALKGMQGDAC